MRTVKGRPPLGLPNPRDSSVPPMPPTYKGYLMLCLAANSPIALGESMPTPITLKRLVAPLAPSSFASADSSGISCTQGAHQVAQKFTSSALPCHWASACGLPDKSLRVCPYRWVEAVCAFPPVG